LGPHLQTQLLAEAARPGQKLVVPLVVAVASDAPVPSTEPRFGQRLQVQNEG
jgi:hypothetical protein